MARLLDKITVDEVNHKYIEDNRPSAGRFAHFRATFLGKLWIMSKTDWMEILFCLPAIAVILLFYIRSTYASVSINYSGNFGLGYFPVTDASQTGLEYSFYLSMWRALLLIPCIIIAFVGLAGVFNVVKYEAWGTDVKVARTFIKGVKNNFVPFMWMGLLVGVCFFILQLTLGIFDVYGIHVAVKVIAVIFAIILLAFALIIAMYMTTQASVYNLGFKSLIKNSVIFAVSFIPQNLIFVALSLLPMLLFFLPGILRIFGVVFGLTLGIAYLACVWTIYAQFVFDGLYSNNKKKKKNKSKNIQVKTVASAGDVKK